MIWNLKNLIKDDHCLAEINGKWVPARPIQYRTIRQKIKEAWYVFIGKTESFRWPEGQ